MPTVSAVSRGNDPMKHMAILLMVILLGGLVAGPAGAQQAYLLGPGDVLEISVYGRPELTATVVILPEGRVLLPLVGAVTAAGLTVEALAQNLTRAYAAYIKNPRVSIVLRALRTVTVSVIGLVKSPGVYRLGPNATILDALAAAGGVLEMADLTAVQVLRTGQSAVTIDLTPAMRGEAVATSLLLSGGETIIIREDLVNVVSIAGEVTRPGRYPLRGEMRVLDALLLAGGLTARAAVGQARLVHKSGESLPLALDRLLFRQEMQFNILLQPGDTVLIPELQRQVFVLGDVRNPGAFPIDTELTLLEALALAGGPVPRNVSTARRVHIVRRPGGPSVRDAEGVTVERRADGGALIAVDLDVLQRGVPDANLAIVAGDVIVVPQNNLGGLQVILNILSGVLRLIR